LPQAIDFDLSGQYHSELKHLLRHPPGKSCCLIICRCF
jgi:hypothetical protein